MDQSRIIRSSERTTRVKVSIGSQPYAGENLEFSLEGRRRDLNPAYAQALQSLRAF